jgi:hypothetical protein
MKPNLPAMLLPVLLGTAACAENERAGADADEIEAAVAEANQQAALGRESSSND